MVIKAEDVNIFLIETGDKTFDKRDAEGNPTGEMMDFKEWAGFVFFGDKVYSNAQGLLGDGKYGPSMKLSEYAMVDGEARKVDFGYVNQKTSTSKFGVEMKNLKGKLVLENLFLPVAGRIGNTAGRVTCHLTLDKYPLSEGYKKFMVEKGWEDKIPEFTLSMPDMDLSERAFQGGCEESLDFLETFFPEEASLIKNKVHDAAQTVIADAEVPF